MHDELVGYLLGALDPDEAKAVELALETCKETKRQFDLLCLALVPLLGEAGNAQVPSALAIRTCVCLRQPTPPAESDNDQVTADEDE